MRIILVRHGQPDWAPGGMATNDPHLTPVGADQAQRVGRRLTADPIDHLLVSTMIRADETAAPLIALGDRSADRHDWLREIRNPEWDGLPVERVEEAFTTQRTRSVAELWDGLDGGESFHEFHDRVVAGWTAWLAQHGVTPRADDPGTWDINGIDPDTTIVSVAHAGTNAVTIGALLGIPPVPWEWERFVSWHASVTILSTVAIGGGAAFTLERFSDVAHLPVGIQTR